MHCKWFCFVASPAKRVDVGNIPTCSTLGFPITPLLGDHHWVPSTIARSTRIGKALKANHPKTSHFAFLRASVPPWQVSPQARDYTRGALDFSQHALQ
jgi:hypothetical protein